MYKPPVRHILRATKIHGKTAYHRGAEREEPRSKLAEMDADVCTRDEAYKVHRKIEDIEAENSAFEHDRYDEYIDVRGPFTLIGVNLGEA